MIEHTTQETNVAMKAQDMERSGRIYRQAIYLLYELRGGNIWAVQKRNPILNWISPQPYDQRDFEISSRRKPNTGHWILKSPEVQEWRKGSGLLWGYGIRKFNILSWGFSLAEFWSYFDLTAGAGKTFLRYLPLTLCATCKPNITNQFCYDW